MPIGLLALAAGSLLGGTYLKNRQNSQALDRQQQNQEAYRGLLNQDLQRFQDREQALFDNGIGPVNPGLLEQYTPSNEFLAQAAALPGRENLLQQAVVGEQAMARQRQGQIWESENMTMSQKAALEAQQQQRAWEQSRREFEHANPSAYQQAQIGNARQGLLMQQEELGLKRDQMAANLQMQENQLLQDQYFRQFPAAGLTGTDAIDYMQSVSRTDNAVSTLLDARDFMERRAAGEGRFSGDLQAQKAAIALNVQPVIMEILNTGVLQEAERASIEELMGDPTQIFTTSGRQTKNMAVLQEVIERHRENLYRLGGREAPKVQLGSSAFREAMRSNSRSARSIPRKEDLIYEDGR